MQATTCHFSIVGYRNPAVDGRALAINFYVPSVIHPKVVLPQKVQISIRVKAHRSLFLVRFLFSLGHKTLSFSPLMFKGFVIGFCTHKHTHTHTHTHIHVPKSLHVIRKTGTSSFYAIKRQGKYRHFRLIKPKLLVIF